MVDVLNTVNFETSTKAITQRIASIDPINYAYTRNYIDGKVTYLSPYISRGVISTKQVLESVLDRNYAPKQIEKFIQELAWRDYWQQIWISKGNAIDSDLKQPQTNVQNQGIPQSIVLGKTGIVAIDGAIHDFYNTGYMHNHVRMYIASICTNIAHCHWRESAQWMYAHLFDGDWASNALSWQWVAGTNSSKKYYANQNNINKFCYSRQQHTFLDASYETLTEMPIPESLKTVIPFELKTLLPQSKHLVVNSKLPTLIYNAYNLDPDWKKGIKANRILLLEPSHFKKYPVSDSVLAFILGLSNEIQELQIWVGEFQNLIDAYKIDRPYFKEHPTNTHYKGMQESRDWMFSVKGYYPSFFSFWKKCKKELRW